MSLCCFVLGHSVTKIGLPETKLGIIPGAGGTQRLTRLVGLAKAKNLIFTGRGLSASQAWDYGEFFFSFFFCVPICRRGINGMGLMNLGEMIRCGGLCFGFWYICCG